MHRIDIVAMSLSINNKDVSMPACSIRTVYGVNQIMAYGASMGDVYNYEKTALEKQQADIPFFNRYIPPDSIKNTHQIRGGL